MNRAKYLFKNTAIFALSNIGTKLINFFLIPLYTYVLTTEQYGIIDLVFTITTIAVPILILNVDEGIMRFALDKNIDSDRILSIGLGAVLFSIIGGFILRFFASLYVPVSNYAWFIYFYAITSGASNILLCYLRGREKLLLFSIGNIVRSFSIAGLNIVFLLHFKMGINGYMYAYIFANVITICYSAVAGNIRRFFGKFNFDMRLFKQMLVYALPLIPNSLMWWIMNSLDRIMITSMISVSVSGIYAVSSKIPSLISTVSTIFNQAYSYSAIKENDSDDREEFNNRIFKSLLFLTAIVTISLMMVLKPFMRIYTSPDFYTAWIYSPPLIVGTAIMVLGTFFSVFYTVNKDGFGFLKSGVAGAVINVLLNFLLISQAGAFGASIATCISYIIVALFRFFDTRKYITLKVFSRGNNLLYVSVIISMVFVYFDTMVTFIFDLLVLVVVICSNKQMVQFWKSVFMNLIRRKLQHNGK